MKRIVIFGASSLLGQQMRLCIPPDVEPIWIDLTGHPATGPVDPRDLFLRHFAPQAVINLDAGENRADIVERAEWRYREVNVQAPAWLSWWCAQHGAHYVHLSSDQVFGGEAPEPLTGSAQASPPFAADSVRVPVNRYGGQKLQAEMEVGAAGKSWTVVRPGFLLGVRPMPLVGRENFAEHWLSLPENPIKPATLTEVADRWFSPTFAWDLAQRLWEIAQGEPLRRAVHVALPIRTSRYEIAQHLRTDLEIEAVPMETERWSLPLAEDTTFEGAIKALDSWSDLLLGTGLQRCEAEYASRQSIDVAQREREIAIYGDQSARDYGPTGGFLSERMDLCAAIAARLKAEGVTEALCLGDTIGDLTIALGRAGIHGIYGGAKDSAEAKFAEFRQWLYLGQSTSYYIDGPATIPAEPGELQAVIALEPLSDEWLAAIHDRLKPGGWLYLHGDGWNQNEQRTRTTEDGGGTEAAS